MSKLNGNHPILIRRLMPRLLPPRTDQPAVSAPRVGIPLRPIDLERQLRWCVREIRALQIGLWMLSVVNLFLLSALSVMLFLYIRAFWR
jgi:hypothetical protein